MTYTLALTFSNFQHIYGIPHFTLAIAVKTRHVHDIPELFDDEIIEKINEKSISNAFNPSIIEDVIHPYEKLIVSKKIYVKERPKSMKNDNQYNRIIMAYYKLLDNYVLTDLELSLNEIDSCIIKLPMNNDGIEMKENEIIKQFSFGFYNFPITFQSLEDSSGIMDLARLLANDAYLKERRKNSYFINAVIKNNLDVVTQIIRLSWNSIPIEFYNDVFVGHPNLLIRKKEIVQNRSLILGDDTSFFPVAKFCAGPTSGVDEPIPTCISKSSKQPFGTYLEGTSFERCSRCGGGKDNLSFLFRAQKNNKKIMNEISGGIVRRVLLGDFALYATIFDDTIKIGRTLKNRVISRLIEQSSLDALVIYPVQTYELANKMERMLKNYLKKNIKKIGFNSVTDRVFQSKRYEYIKKIKNDYDYHHNKNMKCYEKIIEIMNSAKNKNIMFLSYLDNRIINLYNNWFINNDLPEEIEKNVNYNFIKGNINNLVGTFITINNKTYDFKKINGYVCVES